MSAWWDSVDRIYLFLLLLPVLIAIAGYLRYRWDERKQRVSSGAVLFGFWLTLSGYLEPFLISAGAASAAAVVWLAHRMALIDREGHPIHLGRTIFTYCPGSSRRSPKARWDVTKIILNPRLPVTPELLRVKTSQRTSVGLVTYANSITLTPGTISVEVADGPILVHAITKGGASSLATGDMDRGSPIRGSGLMFTAAAAALLVALALVLVRAFLGPSVFDRIQAGNTVGTLACCCWRSWVSDRAPGVPRYRDHVRLAQYHRHDRGSEILPVRPPRRAGARTASPRAMNVMIDAASWVCLRRGRRLLHHRRLRARSHARFLHAHARG